MRAPDIIAMMEAAGCSAEQIVAAIKFDAQRRITRRCERAVAIAVGLAEPRKARGAADSAGLRPPHPALRATLSPEGRGEKEQSAARRAQTGAAAEPVFAGATGDKSEPATGDKFVTPSGRPGPKQVARKVALTAPGFRGQTRSVFSAAIEHADAQTGELRASNRRLAASAAIGGRDNGRAVQRGLRTLEAWGFLVPLGPKARGTTRPYRVNYDVSGRVLAEIEGPETGRRHPACFRGGEGAHEREMRALRTGDKPAAAQRGTNPATGDTPVPQTLKKIQTSSQKVRSVARGPKRQLELPGTMGVVGGTESRQAQLLRRAEQAILAKYPKHREQIYRAMSRLDATDHAIIAQAEDDRAGDGGSAIEGLIGIGRGPPRAAGAG